jgi:hypothetical protein
MKVNLIWFVVSALAFFGGTRVAKQGTRIVEKPVEVIKTKEVIVEKPVEVIREVPKEIEKIVEKKIEVPAPIPAKYESALKFTQGYFTADWLKKDEILSGIPNVQVSVTLADPARSRVSVDELKDMIELALRKNGIAVKSDSLYFLQFDVSGLWDDRNVTYSYSATLSLREGIPVFTPAGFKLAPLVVWTNGYTGYAGSLKTGEGITSAADKLVISFSNAFLAANQPSLTSR